MMSPAASSKYSDRQEIISGVFQITFLPNCAIHRELDWPVVRTPRLCEQACSRRRSLECLAYFPGTAQFFASP